MIYRPVPDFPNYHVSLLDGEVVSAHTGRALSRRMLQGYPAVRLSRDGVAYDFTVHALIAAAYLGPRPEGMEVRHADGTRDNFQLGNLCYGTRSDQRHDDVRNGVHLNSRKLVCSQGHEYTPENTLTASNGGRRCRECHRQESVDYRLRGVLREQNR